MGTEVTKYADKAMFDAAPIRSKVPRVHLLSATPDPLGAIAAACLMYEGRPVYDLSEVSRSEREKYWEQVKKTHLKAPLEFVDFHFFIEGVDRAFTHQIVRQRTAVYAQESLRFAVKEGFASEALKPPGILPDTDAEKVFNETLETIEKAYLSLVANGVPAEDARALLPHATTTRLHYKTNLRNLLDHAGNRLCTQAQFIWRFVFNEIVRSIAAHRGELEVYGVGENGPSETWNTWQFRKIAEDSVFKPVCFQLGHCPFTATFDRACSIRDRVQAGEFDKIDDREWMLDPNAAREE